MRDIGKVIDRMAELAPKTEQAFLDALDKAKRDAGYDAPEIIGRSWERLTHVVNRFVPYPPVEDWHKQVVAEFTNQPQRH